MDSAYMEYGNGVMSDSRAQDPIIPLLTVSDFLIIQKLN